MPAPQNQPPDAGGLHVVPPAGSAAPPTEGQESKWANKKKEIPERRPFCLAAGLMEEGLNAVYYVRRALKSAQAAGLWT